MNYLDAILLGVIQGLTEFLPVSSSGHLVVTQRWLGLQQDSPEMLAFDLVTHVGTLLAAGLVFSRSIRKLLASPSQAWRTLALALPATGVTAVVGLSFEERFKSLYAQPTTVAVAFAITGLLLWCLERRPRPRGSWRQFGALQSALVGLAQAAAIVPGISRSGATIATAGLLGLRRRWAAEFSFLIAAPAILGGALLELRALADSQHGALQAHLGPMFVGGAVSCVVGYGALLLLLGMLQRSRLHLFSYYLWLLAAVLLLTELI